MEFSYTFDYKNPDRRNDYSMMASKQEWEELATFIWNYAPHLEEPIVDKFFKALATWDVRP